MKRQILASSLVLGTLLAICLSPGCKKADDTGTGTEASAVSSSAPASAAMSDWPSDLPKFQGGQLAQVTKGGQADAFRGAVFTQIKNPESAFQQYKTALESKGWVLDEDISNEVTWAGAFTQGAKNLHISISKDGLMANLMYSAD